MTSPFSSVLAAVGLPVLAQGAGSGQDVTTNNLQHWISSNIVPLLLLIIAVVLLWIGGRGDNAGVARRSISLVVGLVVLGIAVSGKADKVGQFFAQLIIG